MRRLHSLDWIRGLAALAVVLYHAEASVRQHLPAVPPPPPGDPGWFGYGWIGVPVFFVLSGYVIPQSLQQRGRSPAAFLAGRFWRLYPTYLALSLLLLGLLAVEGAIGLPAEPITRAKLLSSLAFGWGSNDHAYLYVGWTLFWETIFYLLMAPLAPRLGRIGPGLPLALFLLVAAAASLVPGPGGLSQSLIYLSSFAAGLGGWALGLRPGAGPLLAFTGGLLLLLLGPSDPGFSRVAAGTALLLPLLVGAERRGAASFRLAPLVGLGTVSYSLYLVQVISLPLAIQACAQLSRRLGLAALLPAPLLQALAIGVGAAVSVLAAWLSWRLLERGLAPWAEARWRRWREAWR